MIEFDEVQLHLGAVTVSVPLGWVEQPVVGAVASGSQRTLVLDAMSGSLPEHSPAAVIAAFTTGPWTPPDGPLCALLAEYFLSPSLDYEPSGEIHPILVPGFVAALRADGMLTLGQMGDLDLAGPIRYHVAQAMLADVGGQLTHIQVLQPLDRHDPSIDDAVIEAVQLAAPGEIDGQGLETAGG